LLGHSCLRQPRDAMMSQVVKSQTSGKAFHTANVRLARIAPTDRARRLQLAACGALDCPR
jgi:hypothetical protein